MFVESCDDFIAQENEKLIHEVKRLKEQVIKLKGKEQVRPSQDNRDSVVKKLEKGSNITSSTSQQDQKSIKHKISRKKSLGHIKCYRCLEKGHYARNCQIKPDEEERLSRSQRKLPKNRLSNRSNPVNSHLSPSLGKTVKTSHFSSLCHRHLLPSVSPVRRSLSTSFSIHSSFGELKF